MFYLPSFEEESRRAQLIEDEASELERLAEQVNPSDLLRALEAVEIAPNASPGAVEAYMREPMTPEQFAQIAAYDDGQVANIEDDVAEVTSNEDNDLFSAKVWDYTLKPLVRGVITAGDALFREVVQRPAVAFGTSIMAQIDEASEQFDVLPDTDLVQGADTNMFVNYGRQGTSAGFESIRGLFDSDVGADLGTGFLPGGSAYERQQAGSQITIRGQEANLGQMSAATYLTPFGFDPGDRAYDVGAGITQFAAEVLLDPATWITAGSSGLAKGGANVARKVGASEEAVRRISTLLEGGLVRGPLQRRRQLDTDKAQRLWNAWNEGEPGLDDDMMAEAFGLVNQGNRRSIIPDKLRPWAQDSTVAERLAEADVPELIQTWQRSGSNRLPIDVIQQLGDASTPEQATRVLLEALNRGYKLERGFYSEFGTWARGNINQFKHAGMEATGMLDEYDQGTSILKLDTLMRAARIPFRKGEDAPTYRASRLALDSEQPNVVDVPTDWLNQYSEFDRVADDDLVKDIAANDFNEPLTLEVDVDGNASLIDGNSRIAAAQQIGLDSVPVRVRRVGRVGSESMGGRGPFDVSDRVKSDLLSDAGDEANAYDLFPGLEDSVKGGNTEEVIYSRADMMSDLARMRKGDAQAMSEITSKVYGQIAHSLGQLDPVRARQFGKEIRDAYDEIMTSMGRYATDAYGNPKSSVFDGERVIPLPDGTEVKVPVPKPSLASEAQQRMSFPLPNVDDIRRASQKYGLMREVFDSKGWDWTVKGTRWFTSIIFKTSVLLRPAYIARTMFDNQMRLGADGMDSLFTSPWTFGSAWMHNPKEVESLLAGQRLQDTWQARSAFNRDITGIASDGSPGSARRTGVWGRLTQDTQVQRPRDAQPIALRRTETTPANARDPEVRSISETSSGDYTLDDGTVVSKEMIHAWRVEMGQAAADPAVQYLLRNPDDWEGLRAWMRQGGNVDGFKGDEALEFYRNKLGPEIDQVLDDDALLEEWVSNEIMPRIRRLSGEGNEELVYAMNGGQLPNRELSAEELQKFDEIIPFGSADEMDNPAKMEAMLARYTEYMPGAVKAEVPRFRGSRASDDKGMLRQWRDAAAERIIRKPDEFLSRSPALRQAFAQHIEELMPLMRDDALRRQVVDQLDNMGFSDEAVRRIKQAASDSRGKSGALNSLEDLQDVALTRAVWRLDDVLFDVSNRSAIQQQFDVILPFVDAWREGLQVWSRLAARNPAVTTRGLTMLRAGGTSDGFIYTDPETGERMFTVPTPPPVLSGLAAGAVAGAGLGSAAGPVGAGIGAVAGGVAGALGGQNVQESLEVGDDGTRVLPKFEARARGVNLMANSLGPGFGPVVQWPAGAFVFGKSEEQSMLRDLVLPFGSEFDDPADFLDPGTVSRGIAPPWAEKMLNAATSGQWNEQQFESMRAETLTALQMTGKYDMSKAEDRLRLERDAHRGAQYMMMMRGLVQGTFLTGPEAEWNINTNGKEGDFSSVPDYDPSVDPDGKWHTIGALANEYWKLVDTLGDPDMARRKFEEIYGVEPWYLSQPKTEALIELPRTREGQNWMEQNVDFVRKYPDVAGFLAPAGEGDEYSYNVITEQIEAGDRVIPDAETQIRLAEQTKARQIYYTAKERMPANLPANVRDERLDALKGYLNVEFPLWEFPIEKTSNLDLDEKIEMLDQMVQDPDLPETGKSQPLREYMTLRRLALQRLREVTGEDNPQLDRQEAAQLREALFQAGEYLRSKHGGNFAGPWQLLRNEVG